MRVDDRRVSEGSSLCFPGVRRLGESCRRIGVSAFAKRHQLRRDLLPAKSAFMTLASEIFITVVHYRSGSGMRFRAILRRTSW
jgi:hypothetical protein